MSQVDCRVPRFGLGFRLCRVTCLFVLSLVSAACASLPANDRIAIEHVTVIDAVAGARQDQRVVIQGERIVSVGPMTMPAPPAGRTVDGTGRFLIPGLWDMHVHFIYDEALTDAMPALFLDHGITSVRDTGGDFARMTALRRSIEASGRPAPRIFLSGPLLDGQHVVYDGGDPGRPPLGVANADARIARARVAALKAGGADFIKIYELVSLDVFNALVEEARRLELPIAAHVPLALTADTAGPRVDSMEHLRNVELACAGNWRDLLAARQARMASFVGRGHDLRSELHRTQRVPAIHAFDQARCNDVMAALKGTIQVPTLRLNTVAVVRPFERERWQDALADLPAEVQASWNARAARMSARASDVDPTFSDWSFRLTGMMARAGVPIGAGTDTPIGLGIPGESLHAELELLVRSGLSPRDALQAATVQPARFLGLEADTGQVRPGMWADLVLLDANPLADITATRRIVRVMSRGEWVR